MKRKILLILVLLCTASAMSFAQLTTGEPSAKKIRIGNRPQAGDFGLFIGTVFNDYKDAIVYNSLIPMPILNFKYYVTNHLEARVGVDANAFNEKALGKFDNGGTDMKLGEAEGYGQFLVLPGVAYHFGNMNILDIYAGAEIPLGWSGRKQKQVDQANDMETLNISNAFTIGVDAFIGIQAFIANLPLAIGVEYGLGSQLDLGLKTKTKVTTAGNTQTTYSPNVNIGGFNSTQFKTLKAQRGNLSQQVRFTLSYYFK